MVRLEKDVSETDNYGRLLHYVYLGDVFINKTLVREGFAYSVSYPPYIKYQEMFRSSQRLAQEENIGLWGATCDISSTPTVSTSTISVTHTTTFSYSGPNLDSSDFSTQAQAQAFFDGCGFSATYDPMQHDSLGVGDGVPRESLP